MKKYIVFNEQGQILRTGSCADADLLIQGANVLEGIADDASQYIQDGVVVDMLSKPDGKHVFDYTTKQWVQDQQAQEVAIKSERNQLLQQSDWTQLPDVPLPTKQVWAIYRQALRDVTAQSGYPFNVQWPIKPQ